jgi:hypothetical protein
MNYELEMVRGYEQLFINPVDKVFISVKVKVCRPA